MDIRKLVIQGLHAVFPDFEIYGETVEQGFTPPCFSVRVLSAEDRAYPNGRRRADCSLVVRFFPKARPETECTEMGPRLAQALEVLPENAARAHRTEWEIQDGVLHFFADYSFFYLRHEDKEPMEHLTLQQKGVN